MANNRDYRYDAIDRNLGAMVANWADRNAAGWVLDALADPRTAAAACVAYVPAGVRDPDAEEAIRRVDERYAAERLNEPDWIDDETGQVLR